MSNNKEKRGYRLVPFFIIVIFLIISWLMFANFVYKYHLETEIRREFNRELLNNPFTIIREKGLQEFYNLKTRKLFKTIEYDLNGKQKYLNLYLDDGKTKKSTFQFDVQTGMIIESIQYQTDGIKKKERQVFRKNGFLMIKEIYNLDGILTEEFKYDEKGIAIVKK